MGSLPRDGLALKSADENSALCKVSVINFISIFVVFFVDCFADFQSCLGALASLLAGSLCSSAGFVNQKINFHYDGVGEANITSNGTIVSGADGYNSKNHLLSDKKSFFESMSGTFSYELERVVSPQSLFMLSGCLIVFGVVLNGSAKMLRASTGVIENRRVGKVGLIKLPIAEEYILSMLYGGVSSLQIACLAYIVLAAVLLLFVPPGEIYRYAVSSSSDEVPLNGTIGIVNGLRKSFAADYQNEFLTEIKVRAFYGDTRFLVKSDVSLTVLLDMIFSYKGELSVVNQGELPNFMMPGLGFILLCMMDSFLKNKADVLHQSRLSILGDAESDRCFHDNVENISTGYCAPS